MIKSRRRFFLLFLHVYTTCVLENLSVFLAIMCCVKHQRSVSCLQRWWVASSRNIHTFAVPNMRKLPSIVYYWQWCVFCSHLISLCISLSLNCVFFGIFNQACWINEITWSYFDKNVYFTMNFCCCAINGFVVV